MAHQFSTKYFDVEFDGDYYGFRYYIAPLGRWSNRDPIAEKGGENLYRMARNQAVSSIDLLGLEDINIRIILGPDIPSTPGQAGGGSVHAVYQGRRGIEPQLAGFNAAFEKATGKKCNLNIHWVESSATFPMTLENLKKSLEAKPAGEVTYLFFHGERTKPGHGPGNPTGLVLVDHQVAGNPRLAIGAIVPLSEIFPEGLKDKVPDEVGLSCCYPKQLPIEDVKITKVVKIGPDRDVRLPGFSVLGPTPLGDNTNHLVNYLVHKCCQKLKIDIPDEFGRNPFDK